MSFIRFKPSELNPTRLASIVLKLNSRLPGHSLSAFASVFFFLFFFFASSSFLSSFYSFTLIYNSYHVQQHKFKLFFFSPPSLSAVIPCLYSTPISSSSDASNCERNTSYHHSPSYSSTSHSPMIHPSIQSTQPSISSSKRKGKKKSFNLTFLSVL